MLRRAATSIAATILLYTLARAKGPAPGVLPGLPLRWRQHAARHRMLQGTPLANLSTWVHNMPSLVEMEAISAAHEATARVNNANQEHESRLAEAASQYYQRRLESASRGEVGHSLVHTVDPS